MNWFTLRYIGLRPLRLGIHFLLWLVSKAPGTTNMERAEMGMAPCRRCMGRSLGELPRTEPTQR